MKTAADSSFLVSCYSFDSHSEAAGISLAASAPDLLISPLTVLEVSNALYAKLFRRIASEAETRSALQAFRADIANEALRLVPLPASSWERSRDLATHYTPIWGVRSLDILHVAVALEMKAESFLTFDAKQAQLARAEGLLTPLNA